MKQNRMKKNGNRIIGQVTLLWPIEFFITFTFTLSHLMRMILYFKVSQNNLVMSWVITERLREQRRIT